MNRSRCNFPPASEEQKNIHPESESAGENEAEEPKDFRKYEVFVSEMRRLSREYFIAQRTGVLPKNPFSS